MLRLIGLLALLVIAWLAVSGGFFEKIRPRIEQAVGFAHRVAEKVKNDMEAGPARPAVTPGEDVSPEGDPYQDLIDERVVTEEFREKPWTVPADERDEPAGDSFEGGTVKEERADRAQFTDSYEETRRKLHEAMRILEGAGSET